MINPNTLQIGNRISYQGYVATVTALATHFVHFCIDGEDHDSVRKYEDIDPIPITEERLRDAGFVEYPTGRFRLDHFVIDDRDHIYLGSTPMVRKGAWHDLQNLVRLISGKII